MGDTLNDQQTEVLVAYQSFTGDEDMERSIQVLRNSDWDLQVKPQQSTIKKIYIYIYIG